MTPAPAAHFSGIMVLDFIWRIVATLGLVALNGYFVAAEFASVGARASRLEVEAARSVLARLALVIKHRLDLYLSTCQLGITMASLGLGAVTEPAVARLVEPILTLLRVPESQLHPISLTVALAIATALHVVVGEVAPKNWAILNPDRLLPLVALPLVIFTYIFYPVIWLLNSASNALLRLSGVPVGHAGAHLPHSAQELRVLVAESIRRGELRTGSEHILTSAFELSELKVRQIMTPRTQVVYLTTDQPIGELLRTVQNSAYTRLPLCEGDIDHVIGLIHMKDLFNHLKLMPGRLRFADGTTPAGEAIAIADGLPGSAVHVIGSGDIDLKQIRRDILFVPETLSVTRMLRQFQTSRVHMAVVVDEYGATRGIVTMEDVLEELVGEIEDEFDTGGQPAFAVEPDGYRASGMMQIHELRDRLNLEDVDVGDVDTINGYVIRQLGRWPRPGDTVQLGAYTLRVTSVSQKRVGQVFITPRQSASQPQPPASSD